MILYRAGNDKSITFAMLEKLGGKCTSMCVAVPPAVPYTHYMYRAIGNLGARRRMNEFPWYSAAH